MLEHERLIAQWRQSMQAASGMTEEAVEELESHLRDTLGELVRTGTPEVEAFHRAVAQLGCPQTVSSEFRKVSRTIWLPVKVVIGIGAAAALAMVFFSLQTAGDNGSGLLLAGHVFTLTLGYLTVFLNGVLGVCFVCQRCFRDFPALRQQVLLRTSHALATLAAGLTGIGILLGIAWAKLTWGRFWEWEPRESAALCVFVWSLSFLAFHGLRGTTARRVFVMSILGTIVVGFAWFGPGLVSSGFSHEKATNSVLLQIISLAGLTFLLVGLAPARCLRLKKS